MSTINRTLYPVTASLNQINRMQDRFATLQAQLGTGLKATNLAELGSDRYFDLSIRARMGRIEGYQSNIGMVNLRLSVLNNAITRLDTIEGDARTAMVPSAYGTNNINFGTAPSLAGSRLDDVLNLLNSDVDGRYLFGGNVTDKKPVAATNVVLDGAAGRAGFRQIVSERQAADVGDGLGRLTVAGATNTVTLTEDGAHPFGFKLSTITTSSAGIALTQPTGTAPQSLGVQFTAQPIAGESVIIGLTMPDGSAETLTLKAVAGTPGPGEYQIGADPDATAANFQAALQTSLTDMGQTTLKSASAFAAADNFFNSQGNPVLRVSGSPLATATTLVAADPATTVFWYAGQDSGNARQSVSSKIDESTSVNYGVQANESGILALVKSLAVTAVQDFPTADATSKARFDAIATRNLSLLAESHNSENGSIEMIAVELGNAQANVASISDRHATYKSQLETMLGQLENVSSEEVAMEMLALQTRLTASYQATTMITQLSLVNYLR